MPTPPPTKPEQIQTLGSAWTALCWHLGQHARRLAALLVLLLITALLGLYLGYSWGLHADQLVRCWP